MTGKARSGKAVSGSLEQYRSKRHPDRTPEPMGSTSGRGGRRRFVVQKHAATSLHYDFRLEAGGVLKSWSVPKGPSTDPREKRLALRTEDHPVDYADFEGTIPEGEYGAGAVIRWDVGTYRNLAERGGKKVPVAKGVSDGHVKVWLEGEKLRGGYALTRTGPEGGKERWLLVKVKDEEADARRNPVNSEPASVRTGRTVEDVAEE
ncbi:DNA polymerase ligase N-terminal domain-containing protein [Streptomyces apocyni]|uniref:DNA polymerase ligase N-terminal domain-containing protein n=1 Tax=Streptomyces apocyni TaxID=2654677 RepID=UPI0012EA0864|nr:DNA polymerase ligase N-terminal domain-containing protein [Streptomyces apocyni]